MRTMRREGEKETERRKVGKRERGEMKNIRGQGYPKEKRSSNSTVISWRNSPGFHFRVYWKLHARDISSTNELESYLASKYVRLEILFGTITAAPNFCLYVSVYLIKQKVALVIDHWQLGIRATRTHCAINKVALGIGYWVIESVDQ